MKKAFSLLIAVCLLIVAMVACTPKKGEDDVSTIPVQTTAKPSTPASTDAPENTEEQQGDPQSTPGGLEVVTDAETGYGPMIPLG